MKNCYLDILGRLKNPEGYTYIFAYNTLKSFFVVKRETYGVTENSRNGGGSENRRVFDSFEEMRSFYSWALDKDWIVRDPLPLSFA